jgi:hypothetical protein
LLLLLLLFTMVMMVAMDIMFTLALRVVLVMLVLKLFHMRGMLQGLLPPINDTTTVTSLSDRDSSKASM